MIVKKLAVDIYREDLFLLTDIIRCHCGVIRFVPSDIVLIGLGEVEPPAIGVFLGEFVIAVVDFFDEALVSFFSVVNIVESLFASSAGCEIFVGNCLLLVGLLPFQWSTF